MVAIDCLRSWLYGNPSVFPRTVTFFRLLSEPTVNEKLILLGNAFVPQPSVVAARPLLANPNFPSTYSWLQNATTLLTLEPFFWIISIIWEA